MLKRSYSVLTENKTTSTKENDSTFIGGKTNMVQHPMKKTKRAGQSVLEFGSEQEIFQALKNKCTPCSKAGERKNENRDNSSDTSSAPIDSCAEEARRLSILKDYLILESGVERPFDKVSEKVASRFGVSWAMISLVDMGRLWFKSLHKKDLGVNETPREFSFCNFVIDRNEDDVFIVPDVNDEDRFQKYALVMHNKPSVRFYAGVPLTVPEGVRVGTLCLMDSEPRPNGLTEAEKSELTAIAKQVVNVLVKRKTALLQNYQRLRENTPQPLQPRVVSTTSDTEKSGPLPESSSAQKLTLKHGVPAQNEDDDSKPSSDNKKIRKGSKSDMVIPKPLHEALLPDPKTDGVDPDTFLLQLVDAMYGTKLVLKTALELGDYFPTISDDQMNAYSMEVVSVARTNNVKGLQEIFQARGRDALDCFNRFGEGLLNMCCRRGFKESVKFLLSEEVGLNVRIRDDCGRTPLHDACWNPEPQLEICHLIMEQDPSLFLITDKRGYTPFQYARNSDWPKWKQFLLERRHLLAPLATEEMRKYFT